MKVILISGKAQHGKDTTANLLKEILIYRGAKVLVVHYADLLKYICKSYFNWNGEKDEYGRHLLQYVGTDIIRKNKPSFWVDFVADILQLFNNEWDYVIIPDCRFPNEISTLVSRGFSTIHIRVVRENFTSNLTNEQKQHPSEIALDGVIPDYYLKNNNDVYHLQKQLIEFVNNGNL